MYETRATVVGTLITRVDKRRTADGTTVVGFRVASNTRRYDAARGSWEDGATLYLSVTCWRALGDNVHASFVLGDPIIVHGRLQTREFEKDGRRHSVIEMQADAVGPDLARSTAAITRARRPVVDAGARADDPRSDGAGPAVDDPWTVGPEAVEDRPGGPGVPSADSRPADGVDPAVRTDRTEPGAARRAPAVEAGVGA